MDIQIICAPSILGLKPTGVELLPEALLDAGLAEKMNAIRPPIRVLTLNERYNVERDANTNCLNSQAIMEFSSTLAPVVSATVAKKQFALTLGGDCSILLGIMAGLKSHGNYGLVFMDAHGDFYLPHQSPTGEVADMDLGIVTGRGPEQLTNINNLAPYVTEENTIHIGQRDKLEAIKYGSDDVSETGITCFDLAAFRKRGIRLVVKDMLAKLALMTVDGLWIHFDTDVLSDDVNHAVDYRLAGGMSFGEVEVIQSALLQTGRVVGMSVSIFNPKLDREGIVAANIVNSLRNSFYRPKT
jgi:arginase